MCRLFLPLALLLAACGPQRVEKTELDLAAAITEAVARGDTASLRVFIEVPFAFDRLYIAGPGTSEATIAAALGNDNWVPAMARGIDTTSHFHLLVFETSGRLVPAALPKRVADIAPELVGRLYGPDDAVFSVRKSPGGGAPTLAGFPATPASAGSDPD
jgi:hypothetical protein